MGDLSIRQGGLNIFGGDIKAARDIVGGNVYYGKQAAAIKGASVIAYLKAIAQPPAPPAAQSQPPSDTPEATQAKIIREQISKMFAVPFTAHSPSQPQGKPLYEAMLELYKSDRQFGRNERILLLADTGMGKSPAMDAVRVEAAKETLAQFPQLPDGGTPEADTLDVPSDFTIPITVRLGDLQSGLTLQMLVRDAFNALLAGSRSAPLLDLDQGMELIERYAVRCQFMFDDLDVMLSRHFEEGLDAVIHFMDAYPKHRYLITCRTSAYRSQLNAMDILFLDGLQEQDIRKVLGKDTQGRDEYDNLNPGLQQLAVNRSMLEMILHLQGQAGGSASKGELLEQWAMQLLGTEDSAERPSFVVSILEELAFEMQTKRLHNYTDKQLMETTTGYLTRWQEPMDWREPVRHARKQGLLSFDEEEYLWAFSNSGVEAYFCASAIRHDPAKYALVMANASDNLWREPLTILVGLAHDPSEMLFRLIDQDVLVAAEVFRFAPGTIDPRTTDALVDGLIEQMSQESSLRRQRIVERIGETKHPRVPEALLLAFHRQWASSVLLAIVKALWDWYKTNDEPLDEIQGYEEQGMHLLSLDAQPISSVLGLIQAGAKETAGAPMPYHQRLIDLANDPKQPSKIRGMAVFGLGFLHTQMAYDTLVNLVSDVETDDFLAWCASDALAQMNRAELQGVAVKLARHVEEKPDPAQAAKEQDLLKRARDVTNLDDQPKAAEELRRMRLMAEQKVRQRARALYMLGLTGGLPKPATDTKKPEHTPLEVLMAALGDKEPIIRGVAIEALGRLDLPGTREEIENRLTNERESWVMKKAAEALGQIGTLESISVLKKYERYERAQTRRIVRIAIHAIEERYGIVT